MHIICTSFPVSLVCQSMGRKQRKCRKCGWLSHLMTRPALTKPSWIQTLLSTSPYGTARSSENITTSTVAFPFPANIHTHIELVMGVRSRKQALRGGALHEHQTKPVRTLGGRKNPTDKTRAGELRALREYVDIFRRPSHSRQAITAWFAVALNVAASGVEI